MIDQYVMQLKFIQNSNYSNYESSLLSPKIYFQLIRYYSLAFLSKNFSVKKSCTFNIKQKPTLSTNYILTPPPPPHMQ
jgi:hypothetical protein